MVKHIQTFCRLLPTNCLSGVGTSRVNVFRHPTIPQKQFIVIIIITTKNIFSIKKRNTASGTCANVRKSLMGILRSSCSKKITKSQEKHPLLGAIFNIELSGNSVEHLWGTISAMSPSFFFARKLHHSCFIWSYIRVCWCWVNLAKIYIFLYKGQPLLSHSINFMNICTFKTHYFWKTWRYKLFLLCFLGCLKERNWWFNDDCMLFHAYYSVLQIHFFVWRMANLR